MGNIFGSLDGSYLDIEQQLTQFSKLTKVSSGSSLGPRPSFFCSLSQSFNKIKYGINWRNKERNRGKAKKKESLVC